MLFTLAAVVMSSSALPIQAWQISGDPNATVTVHTYMDYQCRYCRRQVAVLQHLLSQRSPPLRWVNWLWANRGERSEHFASIAYCIGTHYGSDAFHQFNQRFYALPAAVHEADNIALRISLEIPQVDKQTLTQCSEEKTTADYLEGVHQFASNSAEFIGTPGIIVEVNGQRVTLQGVQSSEDIVSAIKKAAD